jgi:hypothetical protein
VLAVADVVLNARQRFERANRLRRGPARFWLKLRDGLLRPMTGL